MSFIIGLIDLLTVIADKRKILSSTGELAYQNQMVNNIYRDN